MRFSSPSTLTGTLGAIAQVVIGAVNSLWVTIRGYTYGANYQSNSALTANTSGTVFSAASNVNGAIVWRASGASGNATAVAGFALQAHTVAPNGFAVGDALASQNDISQIAAGFYALVLLEAPVFVAAGKGLFWTSSITETFAIRSVSYTLL